MEVTKEVLEAILDAFVYEVVFVDRSHTVRYVNKAAKRRYGDAIQIGGSLFNCHNERARGKIEAFLERADRGEDEMFEVYNKGTGEREFFVPVRSADGKVIGYFERHEAPWNQENADRPVGDYWVKRETAD